MRFFENKVELKVDTVVDFLRTAANILLFGPFRLVQEISKKVVYLSKNDLNRIFFTSVIVALLLTASNAVAQILTDGLSIFEGKMPIALMLFCSVFLLIVYCVVSSKKWTILDSRNSIDKIIMKPKTPSTVKGDPVEDTSDTTVSETHMTETQKEAVAEISNELIVGEQKVIADMAVQTEKDASPGDLSLESALSIDDDFLLDDSELSNLNIITDNLVTNASNWLAENDTFVPNVNTDILHDENVKEYQQRLEGGIAELERIGDTYDKFSEDEVKLLQEKLNAVTTTDRFLSKEFITNFNNSLVLDEECILQHGASDVSEDFTLCAG